MFNSILLFLYIQFALAPFAEWALFLIIILDPWPHFIIISVLQGFYCHCQLHFRGFETESQKLNILSKVSQLKPPVLLTLGLHI